jgi:hypothetical protein
MAGGDGDEKIRKQQEKAGSSNVTVTVEGRRWKKGVSSDRKEDVGRKGGGDRKGSGDRK